MANTDSGGSRTSRGRPYRPIGLIPGLPGAALRVAWMLRVNRLLGSDQQFTTMSTFAAAFQGGCYASGISDSTVSRWETGTVRAPYLAVRRYEELLGLTRGGLVSVADTIYRYAAAAPVAAPTLSRADAGAAVTDDRLDELLERATSTDPMSGCEWDELTGQLFAVPRFYLPRRMWTELSMRLLEETVVADGIAWMQRFESLTRLLGHPASRQAAVDACVRLVYEPGNQVFVEPTSILDATVEPAAATFILRQLTDPVNERARYGALLACVRKVRFGHFTDEQLDQLAPAALDILREPGTDTAASPLAADLLRQLRGTGRPALEAELRRVLGGDRVLSEVHAAGRMLAKAPAEMVVERIIGTVASTVGTDATFTDDVLPILVDEMLYAPVLDTRLNAAILLWATPYAAPVAAGVAAELTRPGVLTDAALAGSLFGALRVVGGAEQRPLIERLVLATGVPAPIRLAAVHCVAHVGGTSADAFWRSALVRYGQQWRTHRDEHSGEALGALVYALGIARNRRLLAQVCDDGQAPAPVREAATWWLARPTRLFAEPVRAAG